MPTSIPAYLNHGRWVVGCPRCNGAELADFDAVFMACQGCDFRGAVSFPEDYEAINQVMAYREPRNRNWRPGETLVDLCMENIDHNLSVGMEVGA